MAKNLPTPQQVSEKWSRNAGAATQSYKDGVDRVTKNPMELAANAQPKWLAGIQRAAQNGAYANGLRKGNLESWKKATLEKGGARYAGGITAGKPKFESAMGKILPHIASLQAELANMPNIDLETGINRATFAIRKMAELKGRI